MAKHEKDLAPSEGPKAAEPKAESTEKKKTAAPEPAPMKVGTVKERRAARQAAKQEQISKGESK